MKLPSFDPSFGALAWPATQCVPMLAASVSLLQAAMASPTVNDILEGNKVLRFAKEAADRYRPEVNYHGELSRLVFGAYSDAAWAVRPDGSSQGGYVIFVASQEEIDSAKPFRLTVADWSSRRLQRVRWSSLAAETQAAATAVDELEWVKACWHLMLFPNADPQSDELARMTGSFVTTDTKSLYDAANSMSAGLKLSERRSAIELSGINERLKAMGGHWKCCNSSQQPADGLTKTSARALCLEAFARGVVSLKFDEGMVAAKKIKPEAKQAEVEELEQAARQLRDGQVPAAPRRLRGEAEGEETLALELSVRCRLQGCDKEVPHPELGQRFCSRRHYYKRAWAATPRELERLWRQRCWQVSSRVPKAWATLTRSQSWWWTTVGLLPFCCFWSWSS